MDSGAWIVFKISIYENASLSSTLLILCFAATATLYPVSMMIKQEELSETRGETRGFL